MAACQQSVPTLFQILPATETAVTFTNTLAATFDENILEYNYFYNGGGVAAADFNNDGLTDLYFTGNQVSAKMYVNKGAFRFEDVTQQVHVTTAGWCTGVATADVNADGLMDLYVCHAGLKQTPNQLFINQGIDPKTKLPKFADKAPEYGLDFTGFCTQGYWFDYDRDGDLDLYLLNHFHDKTNPNFPSPKRTDGRGVSQDRLFRNDGEHFADVTIAAGITTEGYGLSASIADFNLDGWPDVFVANDFIYDDLLYLNQQNGTFREIGHEAFCHTSRFSMGSDAADVNADGWPDLFVADMLPNEAARQKLMNMASSNDVFTASLERGYAPQYARNTLQINQPQPNHSLRFAELGQWAGLEATDWSWSPLWGDLDNDGWLDLHVTNGIPHDVTNNDFTAYRDALVAQGITDYDATKQALLEAVEKLPPVDQPNAVFRNIGNAQFENVAKNWGLDQRGFSNGSVLADLDNDGDLDVVTNNLNAPAIICRNESKNQHFLRLKLNGQGIGAQVRIASGKRSQWVEHYLQRGFLSSQEAVVHVGLGAATQADTVEIRWPSGKFQQLLIVKANQTLEVFESQATIQQQRLIPEPRTIFSSLPSGVFTHQENSFEDFNFEPLLPHRFSTQGPSMAVGDANGDGREDVWVGGPAKIAGTLLMQQANGSFKGQSMPDAGYEDTGGAFFDADHDGDLDLYVVSGGSEYQPLSAPYQDRLYRNDGLGHFIRDAAALPVEYASGSCVLPHDYDRDGDLDLFVGGRVLPTRYPEPAESRLLQNDGKGYFTDVTATVCPPLKTLGLVTAALWTDVNRDQQPDLLVVGEWLAPTLFMGKNGKLVPQSQPTKLPVGWYFSVAAGDFDHDGDEDFLAGNLGLNSRLRTSEAQPVRVFGKDLDGNSTTEILLTHWLHGQEVPWTGRDALVMQYPTLKKKFLTYQDFAKATFADLLLEDERKGGTDYKATDFSSIYLENQGNGILKPHRLPAPVQWSPVRAWLVRDFDADGNLDVLTGGNFYAPDYLTGRYDAQAGVLLLGNGKGDFRAVAPAQSGYAPTGEVASLVAVGQGKKKTVWIGQHNGPVQRWSVGF